jgi:hypothetical protein
MRARAKLQLVPAWRLVKAGVLVFTSASSLPKLTWAELEQSRRTTNNTTRARAYHQAVRRVVGGAQGAGELLSASIRLRQESALGHRVRCVNQMLQQDVHLLAELLVAPAEKAVLPKEQLRMGMEVTSARGVT